jgi:hypothetical protein
MQGVLRALDVVAGGAFNINILTIVAGNGNNGNPDGNGGFVNLVQWQLQWENKRQLQRPERDRRIRILYRMASRYDESTYLSCPEGAVFQALSMQLSMAGGVVLGDAAPRARPASPPFVKLQG